jgi:Cft2 family RNA processing exonuclease
MFSSGGLSINGIRIALDDATSDVCFVSHAHSDHTSAFSKGKSNCKGASRTIIASEETFALMEEAPHSCPSLPITLHPAGHMFGARQLLAETENGRFAYTGDFALHDSYTAQGAEILQCDTLMIDSTYCLPQYRLPKRNIVISEMHKFVAANERNIVVFGAYIRGKSQELVKFLNVECGVAPVVNSSAAKICSLYGKCGLKLDYVAAGTSEAEEAMHHPFVAIMPSGSVNFQFGANLSQAYDREVKTAVATGWAQVNRFPVDAAFALSDHADFKDTMKYIYDSGAKKIICANSGEREAAAYLRAIGLDAEAKSDVGKAVQATLATC